MFSKKILIFAAITGIALARVVSMPLPSHAPLTPPISPSKPVATSPTPTPSANGTTTRSSSVANDQATLTATAPPASSTSPSPSPSPAPQPSPAPSIRPTPAVEHTYTALPFSMGSTQVSATSLPWYLSQIHTPAAQPTNSVLVAVIDTGFALDHSLLSARWWTNPSEIGPTTVEGPAPNCTSRGLPLDKSCNNLDNDGDGYASDWRGYDFANNDNSPQTGTTNPAGTAVEHGTFVAGLIASSPSSSSAGVDQTARIMPLQALTDDGSGTTTSVANAVYYAADHGAQVINMSLGTSSDDTYLHNAITYAISKGAIVVAAAGNDGCNCLLYPANYPEVVAVGASTMTDTITTFSSYGANLDLIAPGQDICSTSWTATNTTSYIQCGGAGTSFATPLVAGALAQLIAAGAPRAYLDQFIDITADKVAGMNGSWRTLQYATGRLDINASLTAATSTQAISSADALFRNTCSGINACSVQLITVTGQSMQQSSKQPTGQASAIYWQIPTSAGTPTLWYMINDNTGTSQYYSSVY